MDDWEVYDHAEVPGDDATIYLMSKGDEYAIKVDGRELMANALHGSEDALADLACDRLVNLDSARVLVGGLGMGFTLAAALRRVGLTGTVTVAELLPVVVEWNRGVMGSRSGHPLHDLRVHVYEGDVGDLVEAAPEPWSAILLDVDNGPFALTRRQNGWLYSQNGLMRAKSALVPGGILGIWSADPDPSLSIRLLDAGFAVEVIAHVERERPTEGDDGVHWLWMARA